MAKERKATGGHHFKDSEIADALTKAYGIVTAAAQILGCNQNTIHEHLKKNPDLEIVRKGARERIIDLAEIKLFQAIDKGERWAILEILHGPGRSRGYVPYSGPSDEKMPDSFTLKLDQGV